MNEFGFSSPDVIEQEELDRLADGELNDAEYRELLARLEEAFLRGNGAPWRRCALALLEAQMLRRELGEWRGNGAAPRETASAALDGGTKEKERGLKRWLGLALACAASFLAAFGLAAGMRGNWIQGPAKNAGEAARQAESTASVVVAPQESSSSPLEAPRNDGSADEAASSWRPAGNLTLAVAGGEGGSTQRVEVPLYSVSDDQAPLPWSPSSAAPAELLQALEEAGHRVTRKRQLWPLTLRDGRQVIIPIEQVVVAPRSAAPIQ